MKYGKTETKEGCHLNNRLLKQKKKRGLIIEPNDYEMRDDNKKEAI